jgi:hypothetical protein
MSDMSRILSVAIVLSVAGAAPASAQGPQPQTEEPAILAVVDRFMLAVSAADASAAQMSDLRVEGGFTIVERPGQTGSEGTVVTRRAFVARPATPRAAGSPSMRERYWDPVVHVRGSLAVVWTPYEFWIDGKTSHCGIDVFDMMKEGGVWKIANVMYTVEPAACESLRPKDPSRLRSRP